MPTILQKPHLKAVLALVLVALLWPYIVYLSFTPRALVYAAARRYGRTLAHRELGGWELLRGDGIDVRFRGGEEAVAAVVLAVAAELYPAVWSELGYLPAQRVLIAIYPDRQSLRAEFGWQQGEDALGVYLAGVIRILSPSAWVRASTLDGLEKEFRSTGPLVHELSHFVLDYATAGNYPRWFSEGLAQLQEYRLTGYLWDEVSMYGGDTYPFKRVDRYFDQAEHQARAYRQALLMVLHLEQLAPGGLAGIVADLHRGWSAHVAITRRTGLTPAAWEAAWEAWIRQPDNPWQWPDAGR